MEDTGHSSRVTRAMLLGSFLHAGLLQVFSCAGAQPASALESNTRSERAGSPTASTANAEPPHMDHAAREAGAVLPAVLLGWFDELDRQQRLSGAVSEQILASPWGATANGVLDYERAREVVLRFERRAKATLPKGRAESWCASSKNPAHSGAGSQYACLYALFDRRALQQGYTTTLRDDGATVVFAAKAKEMPCEGAAVRFDRGSTTLVAKMRWGTRYRWIVEKLTPSSQPVTSCS